MIFPGAQGAYFEVTNKSYPKPFFKVIVLLTSCPGLNIGALSALRLAVLTEGCCTVPVLRFRAVVLELRF